MEPVLSVVMPYLNEKEEPVKTVESLMGTIPSEKQVEIIAIDDCSTDSADLSGFENVRQMRNDERKGVDCCRQMGVEAAQSDNVLIIDAHMRFKGDWLDKMTTLISANSQTMWCCVCLGMGYGTNELKEGMARYHGATMLFVNERAIPGRPARECLEPKWAPEHPPTVYDIPCILGANYFFSKEWFTHIGGLRGLKSWGTSEPFLSLKSYFAGGDCKITKEIEIAHLFRSNAPYTTNICDLLYNKIFLCKTILPKEIGECLMGYLPKDRNFTKATEMIETDEEEIEAYRAYYDSIFTTSVFEYCEKFNIHLPPKGLLGHLEE